MYWNSDQLFESRKRRVVKPAGLYYYPCARPDYGGFIGRRPGAVGIRPPADDCIVTPGHGGIIPGTMGGLPPGSAHSETPPGHCRFGAAPAPAGRPRTYYFHADHLGSTNILTDEDGQVHEHLEYFPDGEVWVDRGPRTPVNGYRFSGKMFDPETGLYDFGQRFYDPRTSLWLGVDPESALRQSARRFRQRFGDIESAAHRMGKPMDGMSAGEMDRLWEAAKGLE